MPRSEFADLVDKQHSLMRTRASAERVALGFRAKAKTPVRKDHAAFDATQAALAREALGPTDACAIRRARVGRALVSTRLALAWIEQIEADLDRVQWPIVNTPTDNR